jgi:hypothetical protein
MVNSAMAVIAGKGDLGVTALTVPQTTITAARIPVKNFIYSYLFLINIIILYNASYLKNRGLQGDSC